MKGTKYLAMRVRHKRSNKWETAAFDVPISYVDEHDMWDQLAEWTAKRVFAYPPETWVCETILADSPGTSTSSA